MPSHRLVVLAAAALLVGCEPNSSDPGETDPAEYARAMCAAVRDWQDGVTADSEQLAINLQGTTATSTVESAYGEFYGSVVNRTEDLLAALDEAGAPAVPDGQGYAEDLRDAVTGVRDAADTAAQDLADVGTDDPEGFRSEASGIRDTWGAVLREAGGTLTELDDTRDSEELTAALAAEPACAGRV